MSSSMINQQILNYKITCELGSGGMATVYEAIHVKLDTKVAIKVLNPLLAANESIRERFMQEAKIMASLNHEGITKVIDFDEEEGRLSIVMEFLEGETLDEHINSKGALNDVEAKDIFIPVLNAFAYAHSKNIVHRDVKPSNIFITSDGKVKIMDFGIAKIIEDGANVLTQTGTQMGTPVYMSPEQVNDSKNIDLRTDIYSLGVTFWFMLAGQSPYDTTNDSTYQIFTKIVNEPVHELIKYPKIDKIIKCATSKELGKRFQSCEEFVNEFSEIKSIGNTNGRTRIIEKNSHTITKSNIDYTSNNSATIKNTLANASNSISGNIQIRDNHFFKSFIIGSISLVLSPFSIMISSVLGIFGFVIVILAHIKVRKINILRESRNVRISLYGSYILNSLWIIVIIIKLFFWY